MNGQIDIVLDTNAAIAFLQGDPVVSRRVASSSMLAMSVISVIEFSAGKSITDEDREGFEKLVRQAVIYPIEIENRLFVERVVMIRRRYRLKLPDAIVAATAHIHSATLLTRDHAFQRVDGLLMETF